MISGKNSRPAGSRQTGETSQAGSGRGPRQVDAMTETRQAAALQYEASGAGPMPIGEFVGAAASTPITPMYAAPAYWFYEMSHAALNPARSFADAGRLLFKNPANPFSYTEFGKRVAA